MFIVTVYENGNAGEFYTGCNGSALDFIIEDKNNLMNIIDITLRSGHSIEISLQEGE